MKEKIVRIGSASGFWGDTASAAPQLVARGNVQYLVFDYLAEVTMSILAAQKAKDASQGYARDFVHITMKALLPQLKERGIKVVANAGGVNPLACRDALAAVAVELGIELKIGVVLGDDLLPRAAEFRERGLTEMFSGAPFPAKPASINAYLGATPIAAALAAGAEVVITGRCVDSAVTLGVLMHEFRWRNDEYGKLAQGTLAGHLVECGAQCTGGLFTDWETVPDWHDIGFPIIEAQADGSFVITKPPGTGGLVTPATVAEQMLYEIGDPRAYHVPDVACDFTAVRYKQVGEHRVQISGATGRAPTATAKVSATYMDGYRNAAFLTIAGEQAPAKARRTAQALLTRIKAMLAEQGLPAFSEERVEVLGAEDMYGANANADAGTAPREVVLKMAVKSPSRAALELFGREFAPAATSMSPGTTGLVGGRPDPSPVIRLFSFLVPKTELAVSVVVGDATRSVALAAQGGFDAAHLPAALRHASAPLGEVSTLRQVKLIKLAHGRSGDKGDKANIGILVRRPEHLAWLSAWLTPQRVAQCFAHNGPSQVERYDLPGTASMNFLLHDVLGGGGMASLRTDNLAKCYAQVLLGLAVPVPDDWVL